jgi:hypothetical protein
VPSLLALEPPHPDPNRTTRTKHRGARIPQWYHDSPSIASPAGVGVMSTWVGFGYRLPVVRRVVGSVVGTVIAAAAGIYIP